jgi:hypothetical protein
MTIDWWARINLLVIENTIDAERAERVYLLSQTRYILKKQVLIFQSL